MTSLLFFSVDEGSAADFIYQSIYVVASQSTVSSSSQTTAKIIEIVKTANIKIAGAEIQRFKKISYVAPKTMVLWSDPNLVDRTALGRLLIMFSETTCVCIVQVRSTRMLTENALPVISVPVIKIKFSDIPLMDAGLDPLHVAKFRALLSKKLCNLCLPESLIFDYPTIGKITDMLTRYSATLPYLKQLVRDIAIEAGCAETIDCDFPLMDAGLGSLDAINFRTLLSRKLCNTWMPETIIFDYPTIEKIAEMLAGHTHEISLPQSIYPASASSTSIASLGSMLVLFPGTTCVCIVQFQSKRMLTESAWSAPSAWSRVRKVTLLSRSGTVAMFDVLDRLRCQAEVEVEISLCDVSRHEEVSNVLTQSSDVDAVFHLAGVNADGAVERQDALSIAQCYGAKVRLCA